MLALDLEGASLVGIVAFYAIVNISAASLPVAFGEMHRYFSPPGCC